MKSWDQKRRLMRRYDQSSKVYDTQYQEEQDAKIRAAINNVTVTPESVILDVGCGTGLLLEHVVENAQLVVGTDISRGLLSETKEKAKAYQNAVLVQSDADNLPLRNETFDLVFAMTLMQNVPIPRVTLNEIRRVSKSDAKIIVTGLKKSFTEKGFIHTLKQADLRIEYSSADVSLKDHVCICVKAPVKSKSRT